MFPDDPLWYKGQELRQRAESLQNKGLANQAGGWGNAAQFGAPDLLSAGNLMDVERKIKEIEKANGLTWDGYTHHPHQPIPSAPYYPQYKRAVNNEPNEVSMVIAIGVVVAIAFSFFMAFIMALIEKPSKGNADFLTLISLPIGMVVFPAIGLWLYYRNRK